jgi:6-pyruvoyl-tetrahydropterin synthase
VTVYKVGVRDHVMIAHSFRGALFGPAQQLHGATYVVDAVFRGERLHEAGVLIDIGRAHEALRAALSDLAYRNLDELPELTGKNTTTEFLAKLIFDRIALKVARGELGAGSDQVSSLEVVLRESHVAFASYEGPIAR